MEKTNKKPEKQFEPYGVTAIRAILLLLVFGYVFFFIVKYFFKVTIPFLPGGYLDLLELGMIALSILIIIGLQKRMISIYYISLVSFGYMILSSIYLLITVIISEYSFFKIVASLFILVFSSDIFVYLLLRKEYFKNKKRSFDLKNPQIKRQELIFVISLILLILLYISLTSSFKG